MSSSQGKKSLYLIAGLMIVFLLGVLWYSDSLFQGSRGTHEEATKTQSTPTGPAVVTQKIPSSASGEADASNNKKAADIQKKLPPMEPTTSKSEPEPTPPPASLPATVGQEKPESPPLPPPASPVAVAPVTEKALPVMPEKPADAPAPETPVMAAPAAALPEQKPAEPVKPVAKLETPPPSPCPFSLLLCSHRIETNAYAMQPIFERQGLAPHIVYTDLGEMGMWWRTLLGCYRNYREALQAIKNLNLEQVVPVKTPFANHLGDYPSEKEAAAAATDFTAKGLFPYLAKGSGNGARLLVGAFPSQAGAQQQQRQLGEMGISARTVRR
jgi:hypothetical protein